MDVHDRIWLQPFANERSSSLQKKATDHAKWAVQFHTIQRAHKPIVRDDEFWGLSVPKNQRGPTELMFISISA